VAATCAGECNKAFKGIYAVLSMLPHHVTSFITVIQGKRALMRLTGKKGFDAPDEDKLKPLMECVLVLYLPCYEKRLLEYETETGAAKGGCRIG
jgi:hypothetical protein